MKAWHVMDTAIDGEAHLLIFAKTANRARKMALDAGLWEFDSYIHTRALRAPQWDGLFDVEKVIEQNSDLPAGAEPFYNEDMEYL